MSLEIHNLTKSFNGLHAVNAFSLTLQPGKITSLIGPNGAGKTTVFNLITGFLTPDHGSIQFNDHIISSHQPYQIARLGICRTFQNLRLFRRMSVLDNVKLGRRQSGEQLAQALFSFSSKSEENRMNVRRGEDLLELVGLADKRYDLADNLSYGQQKLLSIACCLAMEPSLLLLDEPVAGIQPEMVGRIALLLDQLVTTGKTILLIEHDMSFVMKVSDTVVVMDHGEKIAEDSPERVSQNAEILDAYLS